MRNANTLFRNTFQKWYQNRIAFDGMGIQFFFYKIIIKPIRCRQPKYLFMRHIHNPMIDLVAYIFRFRISTSVSFYKIATAQHKQLKLSNHTNRI